MTFDAPARFSLMSEPFSLERARMIMESFDLLFHFFSPDYPLNLSFKHDLGQAAHDVTQNADTHNDQRYGEDLAGVGQVMNLLEADGAKSDDRHVQGVEKTPMLDGHETGRARRYQQEENGYGYFQVSNRIHGRLE